MATRDGKGNIRERANADGSVAFEAYGRRDGEKKYLGSFPTRRAAQHALDDDAVLVRQIARGEMPAEIDRRRTFQQAAKEWLRGPKRSRSVATYTNKLDLYVYPTLAAVPITTIKVGHLEALQRALIDKPGLSSRTVRVAMQACTAVLRFAWEKKYIASNPGAGFDFATFPERAYHWIRTRTEIERMLGQVDDPHRTMFATLVLTGMRRDELLHLQWVDVDLGTRIICVQRGKHGTPKGKRLRYIPIGDALLPVLKRWRLLSGDVAGLVFPGRPAPDGAHRSRAGQAVSRMFKIAAKRSGLEPALRLHDLRHTYASHFVRDGGDIFRLSRYLGHESVVITERYYAHLAPDDYAQDWGRVSVRVQFEDAEVVDLASARALP